MEDRWGGESAYLLLGGWGGYAINSYKYGWDEAHPELPSYSGKKGKIITGGSYLQKSFVIPAKILLEV